MYTRLAYGCTAHYLSNWILKLADDIQVDELVAWCTHNNLGVEVEITKVMMQLGPGVFGMTNKDRNP